jgi:hypothetical protein
MEGIETWLNSQGETSLAQVYINLFPDTTNASIPAVTMLRSSLNIYVFVVYNIVHFSHFLFCYPLTEVTF